MARARQRALRCQSRQGRLHAAEESSCHRRCHRRRRRCHRRRCWQAGRWPAAAQRRGALPAAKAGRRLQRGHRSCRQQDLQRLRCLRKGPGSPVHAAWRGARCLHPPPLPPQRNQQQLQLLLLVQLLGQRLESPAAGSHPGCQTQQAVRRQLPAAQPSSWRGAPRSRR